MKYFFVYLHGSVLFTQNTC